MLKATAVDQTAPLMHLGILEQSPRLRTISTQLSFCFDSPKDLDQRDIINKLQQGLNKLTISFPWIAGQVSKTGDGGNACFNIVPFRETPILVAKDCTKDTSIPSIQELHAAGFPFRLLDENVFAARTTLSEGSQETPGQPYPVFLLQVNFVKGGLILTIQACHSAMDIVGQGQMIQLLAKACRGEEFTSHEVEVCNLDRRNTIPLLEQMEDFTLEHDMDESSKLKTKPPGDSINHSCEWAYLSFSDSSLVAMKSLATSTVPIGSGFVSTDDAVCATLWQAIGRARMARLPPTDETTFVRQVDMRGHMGIPEAFTGNMVVSTKSSMTLQQLADAPLGVVASSLRSELDPSKLSYTLRSNAWTASRQGKGSSKSAKDRSQLVVMSSWTKVACYEVDFGFGLGFPKCVRRPRFSPLEGVVYLLPKEPDGKITAGLCLRVEDMEFLKHDSNLLTYAQYIG